MNNIYNYISEKLHINKDSKYKRNDLQQDEDAMYIDIDSNDNEIFVCKIHIEEIDDSHIKFTRYPTITTNRGTWKYEISKKNKYGYFEGSLFPHRREVVLDKEEGLKLINLLIDKLVERKGKDLYDAEIPINNWIENFDMTKYKTVFMLSKNYKYMLEIKKEFEND